MNYLRQTPPRRENVDLCPVFCLLLFPEQGGVWSNERDAKEVEDRGQVVGLGAHVDAVDCHCAVFYQVARRLGREEGVVGAEVGDLGFESVWGLAKILAVEALYQVLKALHHRAGGHIPYQQAYPEDEIIENTIFFVIAWYILYIYR